MWAIVRQAYIKWWGRHGTEFWNVEVPLTPEMAALMRGAKPKVYIEDGALIISGRGLISADGNTVASSLYKSASVEFGEGKGSVPAPVSGEHAN